MINGQVWIYNNYNVEVRSEEQGGLLEDQPEQGGDVGGEEDEGKDDGRHCGEAVVDEVLGDLPPLGELRHADGEADGPDEGQENSQELGEEEGLGVDPDDPVHHSDVRLSQV